MGSFSLKYKNDYGFTSAIIGIARNIGLHV